MIDAGEIFAFPQYSLEQDRKEPLLTGYFNRLMEHHCRHCVEYARMIDAIHEGKRHFDRLNAFPYLPVSLFKFHTLRSIPEARLFKTLTSSGTTSSVPSRIYLDQETARLQTIALANIMTSFLGQKRLPMLIIDTSSIIKDRFSFSARAAGILGMLNFGAKPLYALNEHMGLQFTEVREWCRQHKDENVLLFGFTFMVWQHFICELEGKGIHLPRGILIHSGGWKKLQEASVDNRTFKEKLQSAAGIQKCHSFYGMVEQIGSVFVECEQGYLHCPNFGDVIIRDPKNWGEAAIGEPGVVQVLSILPGSYPGHSLLTEDLGVVVGIDDCPCKRKGKYFEVAGRVPKAEIRGCSDTYSLRKI